MTPSTRELLLQLAIQQSPAIVALLKSLFQQANPNIPPPTDQEVLDAALEAFVNTLAVDDAWLAAHPNWNPRPALEDPSANIGADDEPRL